MRRIALIVKNRLLGALEVTAGGLVGTRIEVAVEARKIAVGNVEPNTVSGSEDMAGGPQVSGC